MSTIKHIIILLMAMLSFLKSNAQTNSSIYDIEIALDSLEGGIIDFASLKGKKVLFVNVASECGFTSQYEELQDLHERYQDKLTVIGLPCNQFGGQEPGTSTEIASFCKRNYGVEFLITEKIKVSGDEQHPLYHWLTNKSENGKVDRGVKWNFQKYLIDEDGKMIDYFMSTTKPLSSKITNHL